LRKARNAYSTNMEVLGRLRTHFFCFGVYTVGTKHSPSLSMAILYVLLW